MPKFNGKPGPGRPKGALNKATREFKTWAEKFYKSRKYRESAEQRILKGKAPQLETYLAQMLYGKPKETVEIEDPNGGVPSPYRFVIVRASDTDKASGKE